MLELGGVRAGVLGAADQILRPLQIPVVVRRDVGDEISRVIDGEQAAADLQLCIVVHGQVLY